MYGFYPRSSSYGFVVVGWDVKGVFGWRGVAKRGIGGLGDEMKGVVMVLRVGGLLGLWRIVKCFLEHW